MQFGIRISRPATIVLSTAVLVAALPAAAQTYHAPRTAWGDPDLSGIYLNRTSAPLERPEALGDKEFYTPEELRARQEAAANRTRRPPQPGTSADAHYDLEQYALNTDTSAAPVNLRTSIITGKTGRLPAVLPETQQRLAADRAARRGHESDSVEMRSMSERCIQWGFEGPPMGPGGYNPNLQIFQGPGYVGIRHEMMGDARLIPTDGRAPLPPEIRQFHGSSVGHWEGETLVVETTNFNDMPALGRGTGPNLRVTERITRTSPDTILYQYTVTDPTVWEESWSGEYPMGQIEGPIYEYACQEGNYGLPNILAGAREAEREAAEQSK